MEPLLKQEPPPPYSETPQQGYQSYTTQPSAPTDLLQQTHFASITVPIHSTYPTSYGTTYISGTQQLPHEITVLHVGACPVCRIGVLEDSYNWLGILCAFICFPIGILCCLLLKEKKCCSCGTVFN